VPEEQKPEFSCEEHLAIPIRDIRLSYQLYNRTLQKIQEDMGDVLNPSSGDVKRRFDELDGEAQTISERKTEEYAREIQRRIQNLRNTIVQHYGEKILPKYIRVGIPLVPVAENESEEERLWGYGMYFLPREGRLVYAPEQQRTYKNQLFKKGQKVKIVPDLSQEEEASINEWFYSEWEKPLLGWQRAINPTLGDRLLTNLPSNIKRGLFESRVK